MNKTEFIKKLSKKSKLSLKECKNCLEVMSSIISHTLKSGDNISLIGFGKFEAKKRSARKFFNPKTLKSITMPETIVPTFKAGKNLKDAMYM